MIKIIEVIGKQEQEDLSFITEKSTLQYFKNVQDVAKTKGLENKLAHANTAIL
jgi:hypothetical protein